MKKYATHNDGYVDVFDAYGTSLKGYINCTYDELVSTFGEPLDGDGYKVDCEWIIKDVNEGTIATVYNWKNGKNYCGRDGLNAHQIDEWHVGGKTGEAVKFIADCINEKGFAVHETTRW